MDPTTLAAALMLALGLLGADAVIHPPSISVSFEVPSNLEKAGFSKGAAEAVFMEEVYRIAATRSLIEAPAIKADRDKSIAAAFAQTVNMGELVSALQNRFGYDSDRMSIRIFSEENQTKVLVSGNNKHTGSFQEVVTQQPKETLIDLVRRSADVGTSNIDPYLTALYLTQIHVDDKNFQDAEALINYARSLLPRTPVSPDLSRFGNLLGIVKLFQNDPRGAREFFEKAIASDPLGSVAIINAAFSDIQLGDRQAAADRIAKMLHDAPPANEVLLMTAYMTWAAARLGLNDLAGADDLLAKAAHAYPFSRTVFDLWATTKEMMGDPDAAAQLRRKAQGNAAQFENYAEVASLYFQLAWRDPGPVARSKFSNPVVVSFH